MSEKKLKMVETGNQAWRPSSRERGGASANSAVAPVAAPDPEVRAVARRRTFTAAYKRRRGRKARMTPQAPRVVELEAKNARLEREMEQARLIIEVQKKLCALLGIPAAAPENTGSES